MGEEGFFKGITLSLSRSLALSPRIEPDFVFQKAAERFWRKVILVNGWH